MQLKNTIRLAAVGLSLILSGSVLADSYFVVSQKWGKKQDRAIASLGGTVRWSHGPTGVALVESDAKKFLGRANAHKAFQAAGRNQRLRWQEPVVNVEVDFILPGLDAYYPLQWHLSAVGAEEAWANGCTGEGVRVAVLDGGIDDQHPDLIPNLDVTASTSLVSGYAFNEDVGSFWHGTHVAGIVAAANGFGKVLGVAPEATVIGVKVLHDGVGDFVAVLQGIIYAVDEADADIINMSLGGVFRKSSPGGGAFLAIFNRVANYASRKGVLIVAAAGNNGLNWDQSFDFVNAPADFAKVLGVAATGPIGWAAVGNMDFDRSASYTDHGHSLIHVSAPGGDFAYPGNEECLPGLPCWVLDMVLSTNVNDGYSWAAGTSMASPMVAGIAALIKANNPGISVAGLKTALAQTAVDAGKPGHDIYHGRGWASAARACAYNSPD